MPHTTQRIEPRRLLAVAALAAIASSSGCVTGVPYDAALAYHESVGRSYRSMVVDLAPDGSLPPSPQRAYLSPEERQIRIDAVDDFGDLLDAVERARVVGGSPRPEVAP